MLRTSQSNISNAITVHIPGNNSITTEAQHASLLQIARWATSNPDHVRDHQQRPAATFCSGTNGRHTINRLRQELNNVSTYPEDLSDHPDFKAAEAKGFISGNGGEVASRSVVGVVGNRVDVAARERDKDLRVRIDRLAIRVVELEELNNELQSPHTMQAILDAVRADLAADLID